MAGPEHLDPQDIETRKVVMGGIYKELMLRNGTLTMTEGTPTYSHPVLKTPHALFGEICEGTVYTVIEPKDDNIFIHGSSGCDHCIKAPDFIATFTREELENKLIEDIRREQTEKRIMSLNVRIQKSKKLKSQRNLRPSV